jgi:RNA 3'-terminal phosphate cyclase
VPWSPPYDYIAQVWRPFFARIGVLIELGLNTFGFLPVGQGEITHTFPGSGARPALTSNPWRLPLEECFARS